MGIVVTAGEREDERTRLLPLLWEAGRERRESISIILPCWIEAEIDAMAKSEKKETALEVR